MSLCHFPFWFIQSVNMFNECLQYARHHSSFLVAGDRAQTQDQRVLQELTSPWGGRQYKRQTYKYIMSSSVSEEKLQLGAELRSNRGAIILHRMVQDVSVMRRYLSRLLKEMSIEADGTSSTKASDRHVVGMFEE